MASPKPCCDALLIKNKWNQTLEEDNAKYKKNRVFYSLFSSGVETSNLTVNIKHSHKFRQSYFTFSLLLCTNEHDVRLKSSSRALQFLRISTRSVFYRIIRTLTCFTLTFLKNCQDRNPSESFPWTSHSTANDTQGMASQSINQF
jgi:hypothetical protein